jgi:molybdopterin-containing oxidoreductase family iron-sulfur binding subunit
MRTYEASRFAGPMKRNASGELESTTWDAAIETLVAKLGENAGKVAFLSGLDTGSFDEVVDSFLAAIGSDRRVRFEPFAHEALRAATKNVFGTAELPDFDFAKSDLLVSFGTDWEETWLSPVAQQRGYADSRRTGRSYSVYVGPRLSVTGSAMDQWIAPLPGSEILIALALAAEVAKKRDVDLGVALSGYSAASVAGKTGVDASAISKLAERIAGAKAPLVLPPGNELQGTNATQFAAAVLLLNYAAGAVGKTLRFGSGYQVNKLGSFSDVKTLAGQMRGGEVGLLLVHGANPVYAAPQVEFADAMKSVFTVSLASASDETTALADLVLPDHTPYEAWGDAEPVPGVKLIQQPTIQPLFDTRASGDVLLDAARKLGKGDALPAGSFEATVRGKWGAGLDAALQNGGSFQPVAGSAAALATAAKLDFETAKLSGDGDYTLLVYPSLNFYDGRSARFAALQELPNPVTKLVWGSFAEMHPDTGDALGLELGDVVKLTTAAGSVEVPVFFHETIRKDVVALEAGQGHQPVDPAAPDIHFALDLDPLQRRSSIGVNAFELLSGAVDASSGGLAWLSAKVSVAATGEKKLMPRTQASFDQEGRGIGQSMPLVAFAGGDHHGEHGAEHGGGHGSEHAEMPAYGDALHLEVREYDPADDSIDENYRWGMSIDLDACSGCNACIAACAQENNSRAIGETLVRQGREMHWIRLERYVDHHDGELQVHNVPMMCQHCGGAPCEPVCPVYATYHNQEGLNVMVPNRCIGTRYCGNNCPYKVRRFNYFPYDFWIREPENLALNPDVMVRTKGVMEKCSMCVQRINEGKDQASIDGRTVRDGEVITACAQTCPSKAITFGNYKERDSRLSKNRADKRSYVVFHHLNTRPGVTYLKSVDRVESEKA